MSAESTDFLTRNDSMPLVPVAGSNLILGGKKP